MGTIYYVGTYYEVLVHAIFPPHAPADQRAEARDLGLKELGPSGWAQPRQVIVHLYGGTQPWGALPCARAVLSAWLRQMRVRILSCARG